MLYLVVGVKLFGVQNFSTHFYIQVYGNVGLNITEVAHDYNTQLRSYIAGELGLVNSFDTWHGILNNYPSL